MRTNEADRKVHGFRCKLATCKCQELYGPRTQPGRRMHGRNSLFVFFNPPRQTLRASHQLSCFVPPDFDLFVCLDNIASGINARRHARSSQLCLLALSRSDRRVLALLLVRVDYAVLCLRYGSRCLMMLENMLAYMRRTHKKKD